MCAMCGNISEYYRNYDPCDSRLACTKFCPKLDVNFLGSRTLDCDNCRLLWGIFTNISEKYDQVEEGVETEQEMQKQYQEQLLKEKLQQEQGKYDPQQEKTKK